MFKDAQEELKRLEAELLAQEPASEEDPSIDDILNDAELNALLSDTQTISNVEGYENYSNQYGKAPLEATRAYQIYNTDHTDTDLEEYAQTVLEPKKTQSLTGLIITAAVLSAGILGVILWWVIRYWWLLQ